MSSEPELTVAAARWLVSPPGRAAVDAATAALDGGSSPLAVGTRLRDDRLEAGLAAPVVAAAVARRRARDRWRDADRLLFTRTALEQASDPAVSAWRARRFAAGGPVEDRAAGVGGDTAALAARGGRVVASDHDEARLTLLAHNLEVLGGDVVTVHGDALALPPPTEGPVHVDPARRVGERRVRRLRDHRPSVPALLERLAVTASGAGVAVVLSPAVDLDDVDLPPDAELELVQVGGELVEAVAWTGALRRTGAAGATATLLDRDGTPLGQRARGPQRAPRLPVGAVGAILLDVAPAAVRARLHDELGAEVGARRVADRRALLTADAAPPASPWWTARRVAAVLPARTAAVRRWLASADPRPVELVRHGVDGDLAAFRRGLGDPPSGPHGWRVELVRLDRGAQAIVTATEPLDAGGTPVPT